MKSIRTVPRNHASEGDERIGRRLRVAWDGWHYWRQWRYVRRGKPRYRSYVIGPLRFWIARVPRNQSEATRGDKP